MTNAGVLWSLEVTFKHKTSLVKGETAKWAMEW